MSSVSLDKLAITCSVGLRGKALRDLSVRVGGLVQILSLSDKEISQWLCRYKRVFEGKEKMYRQAEDIQKSCDAHDIRMVFVGDDNYPIRLKEVYRPPLILYYKGSLHASLMSMEKKVVAIVGTRCVDESIKDIVTDWSSYLTEQGVHVVSGMALGTDALAHWGALQVDTTSAVLGGGVDHIYPYGNTPLYRAILDRGGAVLSEHPPGVRPYAYHFPLRNRIMSGLSDAVILMQSKTKGGSMITTRYAIEDNRDLLVYAAETRSQEFSGNHALIEQGACKVGSKHDLAKVFGFAHEEAKSRVLLEGLEKRIVEALSSASLMSVVELSKQLVVEADKLSGTLLSLVLKGVIGESPGKRYFKKNF